MRSELREALATAKEYEDADSQARIIKQAVTREIRVLDPTVIPRFTEYSNHSIVPDIVLKWPNEPRERFLFVRPTANAGWLLNEMRFLSPHRPLVFTLEDLDPTPAESNETTIVRQELTAAAAAAGTWITDPSGTEAMAGIRTRLQSPPMEVLSQALVRGGRGVSDGQEIQRLTTETEEGFIGAAELSVSPISIAIEAIENHLNSEQAGRLTRLLRAIWEAGGGDLARFPRTETLGKLTKDDLSYILNSTSEGSEDFWRGVGRAITTEMLGGVRVDDYSANLQTLVSTNLETLQAKGVRLIDEPRWLDEPEQTPRWIVNRGCLGLRGLNWTAYIAAGSVAEFPPEDVSEPPNLNKLRERASLYEVPITQVQLGRDDRAVTYESFDGGDVLGDPELTTAEANFGVRDIERAVAVLSSGGTVGIEFRKKTASGRTSATFPLGSLMRSALLLLGDFKSDERPQIDRAIEQKEVTFQPELIPFDE